MPIELKEVVSFLGYNPDEIKELADLKTKFDSDFVRASNITEDSEPVKKIVGKLFGTLENEIKKVTKAHDLEIDFDSDEIKGKKVTEKLKFAFSKYDEKNKIVLEELKVKAGQGNDEKVKEWETKYEKVSQKAKDYENLLKSTKSELEETQKKSAGEIKSIKLDIHKANVLGKIKFKPDISEFEKEGYESKIAKNYIFDLDESNKFIILDKEGKRIPNPKVSGTFMEAHDVLQEEAVKGKLFQLNPDGGKPRPTSVFNQQQIQTGQKVRQIAKRLGA